MALWLYGYMVVWLCGHGIWRYAYMAILLWPCMAVYGYASMASVWVNLAVCNSMALRLDLKTYEGSIQIDTITYYTDVSA